MPGYETDMAPTMVKLGGDVRVHRRDRCDLAKHSLREEGIVVGTQQERRSADCRKEANRAGPMIVVASIGESVYRGRDCIVEFVQRARFREGGCVEEVGIARQSGVCF